MTPGEIVVPQRLQTPEVLAVLQRAGAPLQRMQVGHRANRINPRTGAPEFDDDGQDTAVTHEPQGGIDEPETGSGASLRVDADPMDEIIVRASPLPLGAPILAYPQAGNDPTHPDYMYKYPDGSVEILSGGTAAWRMNNPGNLRYSDYGNALRGGAIGVGNNGNAIFPDVETGQKAFDVLINGPRFTGPLTVDQLVEKYTGRDNPDLASYQSMIRQHLGVSGDTLRSDLSPEQQEALRNGLLKFENTTAGTRRAEFPPAVGP